MLLPTTAEPSAGPNRLRTMATLNKQYHMVKLNDRLKLFITLLFIFTFKLSLNAQGAQEKQYLTRIGVQDSIYSEELNESRTIYLQFPADYNPDKGKKYPVAFILDGEIFLPTLNDVQNYYSGGYTPEMILVGVSNSKNRTRDLTTSVVTEKYGMPFNEETGGAERFGNFIEKELIPYIEAKFPVTNYRTLIGHSYGGLFTIYTFLNKPDLFANYLAIDPSLDWNEQEILAKTQSKLSTVSYSNKSLFVSLSGQLHMQDSNITIDNVMQDKSEFTLFARSNIAFRDLIRNNEQSGLDFNWKFYPNDIHGTVTFPSLLDGLVTIFNWYQMENTDRINSFDTPKNELYNIVKYREKKLNDHFGYKEPPYPEELLNMSGYMNMEMNQIEKAKMYFEFAIEYYPQSANAYDSLADFYEAQGNVEAALQYVQKAAELSDDDYYKNRIKELKNN